MSSVHQQVTDIFLGGKLKTNFVPKSILKVTSVMYLLNFITSLINKLT